MSKTVYLSVDWDFFVREDPAWDWGHMEAAFFAETLWQVRAMTFGMQGLDLRTEMSPWRHSYPVPDGFLDFLRKKLGLKFNLATKYFFRAGDSHAHAFQNYAGEDLILNFDAHHDCGYTSRKILREWYKEGKAEAGSWLWLLLKDNPKLQARIFYPKWKGWVEYENSDFNDIFEDNMFNRVWFDVVNEDTDWSEYKGATVTGVYVAHSRAWTPPWLDEDFDQFLADMYHELTSEKLGPAYCPVFREFDWKAVELIVEQHHLLAEKIYNANMVTL